MGIKDDVYEYVAKRGERGATDAEIAEALGKPRPSVRRYRRELQLESRIGKGTDQQQRGRAVASFVALDELARPTKVGCPLCSEKGWIVRAPKPDPIPMPEPKVIEVQPLPELLPAGAVSSVGVAVPLEPEAAQLADVPTEELPEPLVQPRPSSRRVTKSIAPEPKPEPPRYQYLMGVSQRY